MAPLSKSDLSPMAAYHTPKPDPQLLNQPIIGARFTPIHVLLMWAVTFFPLMMFIAYRTTIKEWSFKQYARVMKTEETSMLSEKQPPPNCIDLETALKSTNLDDADLCWEINEDDIRTSDTPDQVFSERVLERCLLQAEMESQQKREKEERDEREKQEMLEKQRNDTAMPPSGLSYTPLTAEELAAASEGLEPIIHIGLDKSRVYYNAHQKMSSF
ncbi:hypothetical protein L211DRAFT_849690 [Terfezia boudieri ATCC MYA-4762]|uniref:Uncharacterized protein n=1 Tax=Terfezia boudieri ATCC MYA-4762 TaxID=1051890 RepID=A0A3N4LKI2_9PEZI|nr:hypothetical protein L211DRAFT_849690 [Terfezia boudieri ATCC MYA-4762]